MSTNNNNAQDRMDKHMSGLNRYRESIYQLQSVWDNLSLLAQLSGTGTDMTETRTAFSQVTNDVLTNLSKETLNKTVTGLTAKAQVIVDIVIRNLFERTADIGFLATDDDIRLFLAKEIKGESSHTDINDLRMRFREYVKKYSVYSNIILLDPQGRVLVQLDEHNPVMHSTDELIGDALSTQQAYVEIYRKTDLLPNQDKSLVYAYRVTSPDHENALGVLCLCFRFENEMEGVFNDLITGNDWAIGIMLDKDGGVIATSDQYQVPLGAKLEITADDEDWKMTRFAGREYLTVTKRTKGYQGYMGPGWMGHAMIPLEHAFGECIADLIDGINPGMLSKVMRSPLLFSQNLLTIPKKAAMIQSKLNQSVWNGNIWQTRNTGSQQNSFSKVLLWEISNTGFKTQNVIEKTVSDLYQTVVSIMLENSRFFAFLAVDIMDRNLYERANDCRWWALTSSFRKILSKSQRSAAEVHTLEKILGYINGLYTVYDNLVIFDRQGKVLAVSNPSYRDCVGTVIESDWASQVRGIRTTQEYVVSKFEPTPLYKNKPTYVYAAAIRAEDNTGIVGGIGIVFDSQPQFAAMLQDSLPRDADGHPIKGSFTLYIDGDMKIISSTLKAFEVGGEFAVHPNLCKLAAGEDSFDIAIYDGRYYAVGACASAGYREYKGENDAYKNQITALIFIPLGNAREIDALIEADKAFQHNQFRPSSAGSGSREASEYATFYIGQDWFGIPASQVVQAIEPLNIRPIPDTPPILQGVLQHQGNVIPIMNMAEMLKTEINSPPESRQIIIIQSTANSPQFGILVSALGEIPSIEPEKIKSLSEIFLSKSNSPAVGITRVPSGNNQSDMLTILSADILWQKINVLRLTEEAA
ncbi:hypothetical protein MTYP_00266 [Methylophilaceae bacterium]|nr:hypothetical protein MTYP_00266 [Methylophilaceae bacterium]